MRQFDRQLLSQCGSMYTSLSRSVPEIHKHVAGTLSRSVLEIHKHVAGTLSRFVLEIHKHVAGTLSRSFLEIHKHVAGTLSKEIARDCFSHIGLQQPQATLQQSNRQDNHDVHPRSNLIDGGHRTNQPTNQQSDNPSLSLGHTDLGVRLHLHLDLRRRCNRHH